MSLDLLGGNFKFAIGRQDPLLGRPPTCTYKDIKPSRSLRYLSGTILHQGIFVTLCSLPVMHLVGKKSTTPGTRRSWVEPFPTIVHGIVHRLCSRCWIYCTSRNVVSSPGYLQGIKTIQYKDSILTSLPVSPLFVT